MNLSHFEARSVPVSLFALGGFGDSSHEGGATESGSTTASTPSDAFVLALLGLELGDVSKRHEVTRSPLPGLHFPSSDVSSFNDYSYVRMSPGRLDGLARPESCHPSAARKRGVSHVWRFTWKSALGISYRDLRLMSATSAFLKQFTTGFGLEKQAPIVRLPLPSPLTHP
jgi:hypothetical protein